MIVNKKPIPVGIKSIEALQEFLTKERAGEVFGRTCLTDLDWKPLHQWLHDNCKTGDYCIVDRYNSEYYYSLGLFFKYEEDYNLFLLTFKDKYVHHTPN